MSFLQYLLRRVLLMFPTLFGITLVTFAVVNLAPGGPVEQKLQSLRFGGGPRSAAASAVTARGQAAVSSETLEALRAQYGFDRPVHVRYWNWLKRVARLDFGDSWLYGQPAIDVIASRFPVSIQFGVASLILTYSISISLGLLMAWQVGRSFDRAAGLALIVAASLPIFTLAILLLLFLAGGSFLDIFPVGYLHSDNYESLGTWGKIADRAHHFVLPLLCYTIGSFTGLALLSRNSVLEQIRSDYIRTARAKGVDERGIYLRHALRNALIPIVTGIGGILSFFLTGSLLVESTFQLNGIGLLGFQSLLQRDYNVIMALIFISSALMLVGNLLGDIVYVLVDPRIDFS
jgi:microcin C transport system permease protein